MATDSLNGTTHFDGAPEDHKLEQDHKRERDTRRKYAYGTVDRSISPRDGGRSTKPAVPFSSRRAARADKRNQAKDHAAQAAAAKNVGKHRPGLSADDVLDAASGAEGQSTDESVREPSPAPDPEAEITYSFDAPRGATHGEDVLSSAVTKAIERFETRETQKLVDREYDVVSHDGDHVDAGGYAADDDFELL